MSIKHLFVLLPMLAVLPGCNLMERQSSPNVTQTPPYLQPRSELAHSQLEEMRAFHEKESARISEDLRSAHIREMERLDATGKELEKDKFWQENHEKTLKQSEQRISWFKQTDKDTKKSTAPVLTSRIGSTTQNIR